MNSLKLALSFFTRLPVGNIDFSDDNFVKAIKYTPIVGIIIGIILSSFTFFMRPLFQKEVVAFFIVVLYIFITGGLHLDGLSDTCDGIFSNRSPERILEIMKDSRVGSFGVISMILIIVGNIIFLMNSSLLVVFLFVIVGKCSVMISCKTSQYSRESGMGKTFVENAGKLPSLIIVIIITMVIILISLFTNNINIIIALFITYILSCFMTKNISKKINGITGDVLGFLAEVSQLIFLISCYIGSVLI
ncbi:adenosylcobinamide-GDP ribazoletransferase [Clostridium tarantellae]|uniref:Adenosylcobinamide-GDP ribazoletransferase n=1 Tax=Clostridium tarantellae TaxID=39493 RepID=A0A6I1MN08_9CLOT|nr:adenosylcobinamide-GDP ribazoletransferase [Clostridium tarantellae]MPQ44153.1 adenosylcobinamide-GDP ribazoletransferase [Clostridium tarantellae]